MIPISASSVKPNKTKVKLSMKKEYKKNQLKSQVWPKRINFRLYSQE